MNELFTEDSFLDLLDLRRKHQKAADYRPYGLSDPDKPFKKGDWVRICLPYHVLRDKHGMIIGRRSVDGKYEVASEYTPPRGFKRQVVILCEQNELRKLYGTD